MHKCLSELLFEESGWKTWHPIKNRSQLAVSLPEIDIKDYAQRVVLYLLLLTPMSKRHSNRTP